MYKKRKISSEQYFSILKEENDRLKEENDRLKEENFNKNNRIKLLEFTFISMSRHISIHLFRNLFRNIPMPNTIHQYTPYIQPKQVEETVFTTGLDILANTC